MKLRSQDWFGRNDKTGFIHRSWMKNQGIPHHEFEGKPIIGICQTWSDLTPCNGHFRQLAERVKLGVAEAGGFAVEFPVMSLGEPLLRPTAALFRNLMSMDVEESIRGNPIDGVVLLTGCDKTTPGPLMGAASVDLPTMVVPGGPMLNGKFEGKDIGSGTDLWRFSEQLRCGQITCDQFVSAESCMHRSHGHCMSMGTASTMACLVEGMGMTLPGGAAIPAVDARRYVLAQMSGSRIVEMVREDLRMSHILTREALENGIMINAAIGGSTNAVIHLLALARRLEVPLCLDDFDRLGREVPLLANLMPAGQYLMEDFYYAGGLPVVLRELAARLHGGCVTVNGKSLQANNAKAECYNREVIRSTENALLKHNASIAVMHGNLAERGAILKPAAASPALLQHRGRAVVFENIEDYHARIDDDALDVDASCVLVLKMVGPCGYPGMPEVGNMGLPRKLLDQGVKDMIRISDGRMSGTAFGTVFLHVAPEAAIGGNLALVQNGDMIEVDVAGRRLHLDVDDAELACRRAAWQAQPPVADRGYASLYLRHVLQADEGCDFDFLRGKSGAEVKRDSH